VSTASSDIEEQASRLQARIRRETAYVRPQRNPFQFETARPSSLETADVSDPPVPPAETLAEVVDSRPSVTLAGVAEDRLQQGIERTAILSSPAGVLLVRVGDEVLGQYRVTAVEEEAVELLSLADGSTLRLSLAR
jgi:Tfp pilus assembly protein PilP